jgi:periplasmic protein TonB
MAYQALLFCPDEKTARTVTQVLSELDFTVVPCTEPFASVKQLMAGHFDAVVVDCDNEQNAALLFKSALNSSHNQTSLAVAVVEGQAGVAKAFRIGANLVLTKPINVEQAKGTLRVARGLLRKSEAAKPGAPARPAPPVTTPGSPTTQRTARPIAPAAPATTKPMIPAPRPVVASLGSSSLFEAGVEAAAEIHDSVSPAATSTIKPDAIAPVAVPASKAGPKAEKIVSSPARGAAIVAYNTGAASAPALAREPQEQIVEEVASPAVASPEYKAGKTAEVERAASISEAAAVPASPLGIADSTQPTAGGRKKVLLPILAVAVLGAAAYAAYTQFPGKLSSLIQPLAKPAATPVVRPVPATVPQGASPLAAPPKATASVAAPSGQKTSPSTTSIDSKPAAAQGEDSAQESGSAAAHPAKPSHSPVSATGKAGSSAKPTQAPLVIKHNSSTTPDAAEVPPPSPLGFATSGSGGSLPNLIANDASAPQPVLQAVNVSQGVSKGLLLKKVQPTYPPSALRMRVEGTVELMATISAHGNITGVKVLSGMPLLADAAAAAVKQWKYKPYLLNGAPVEITTQITVKFKAPQ